VIHPKTIEQFNKACLCPVRSYQNRVFRGLNEMNLKSRRLFLVDKINAVVDIRIIGSTVIA
jgi:hypothetical protein